jgi:hypothetical protein
MMGDPINLVLLKADFSDPTCFKGAVKVICGHKMVVDNAIESSDEKRLNLRLLTNPLGSPIQLTDLTLYFENAPKAAQAKIFIENNKRRIIERQS